MFIKATMLIVFIVVFNISTIVQTLAQDNSPELIVGLKAVYGKDDRIEVFAADKLHRNAAQSVAALFYKPSLAIGLGSTNSWTLSDSPTLRDNGWCESEPFSNQPATAYCTGFLIGPDKLATSAHCAYGGKRDTYKHGKPCSDIAVVFDYTISDKNSVAEGGQPLESQQLYFCEKVVTSRYDRTGSDWAVLQLDRPVTGRSPLEFYADKHFRETASISVIGHPLGLPAKVSTNASVLEQSRSDYVITNLDTYDGNSGSPVFITINNNSAKEKLKVIGILSRGEKDDEIVSVDDTTTCKISRRCDTLTCSGEHVTRITELPEFDTASR